VRVSVDFDWTEVGSVVLDDGGKVKFPKLPSEPGIYQLDFQSGPESALYIGETDNLRRRSGNYRNPGPRQRTSLRINGLLLKHLRAGGDVGLVVTQHAKIEIAGEWADLPLDSKAARLVVESSALLVARKNAIRVENL
jgi:hypothetical protein